MSAIKKDEFQHPLRMMVDIMVAFDLDFYVVVGGTPDEKKSMGFPAYVAEDGQSLTVLQFPAQFMSIICPTADDEGMSCQLSFDALYGIRIPWNRVVAINCAYGNSNNGEPGIINWPAKESPEMKADTKLVVDEIIDNVYFVDFSKGRA